jgi:eukaryotic-like serine/threonine-protein kinase
MLEPSTRLGPYEIVAPLGAGGMSEVYRARDTRLERQVAVKVLPPPFAHDPERRARFEREAKAVAALSHPNILAIHDCGTEHGVAYAVMELLEGETLRRRLAHGAVPWRKAVEIAAAIADGLAAAHARGIVHRDLKPDNLFLTSDGRVKILDFGLARLPPAPDAQTATASYHSAPTDPGTVMGTAGYMAPEQARGEPADARSDLFALGCVLYEMVTGRRAFNRETKAETMTAILHDEPPDPSDSGTKVPSELERVIRHCLEKRPGERFESARDLAFALRALLSDSGLAKTAPGPAGRLRRAAAAGTAVALAGGLLAALLVLRAGSHGTPGPDQAIDSIAVLPLADRGGAPDTEFLGDGITECLINNLARLPDLRVLARSIVFHYKGREVNPQAVGRELKVRAVLTGRVAQRGDTLDLQVELVEVETGAQLWGERYRRRFADVFAVQEEVARQIAERLRLRLTGDERRRLAKRHPANVDAFRLYLLGRFHWNKRSRDDLERGAAYFRQAIAEDPTYAPAHAGLADSYLVLATYNYLAPGEALPQARAAANRALELDPELGEAYTSRAWIKYVFDWDWPGAEEDFRRALRLNPGYATGHHWYADYLTARGQFDEAEAAMRRAHELDPFSDIIDRDLAWPVYFARRYDQAIAQLHKVLQEHEDFSAALCLLGRAYEQKGRYEEAVAALQKAVTLSRGNTSTRAMLAHTYARMGKAEEARRLLAELEELSRHAHVSAYALATVHAALGETHQAFAWLQRAAAERSSDLVYLLVDPKLDALRSDPRFRELTTKLNVAP